METTRCLCVYPPSVYITDRSLSHMRTCVCAQTYTLKEICENSWGKFSVVHSEHHNNNKQ